MNDLFPDVERQEPKRCKTCIHRIWRIYTTSKDQYCELRKSKKSSIGLVKVKASDIACNGHEEMPQKQQKPPKKGKNTSKYK